MPQLNLRGIEAIAWVINRGDYADRFAHAQRFCTCAVVALGGARNILTSGGWRNNEVDFTSVEAMHRARAGWKSWTQIRFEL